MSATVEDRSYACTNHPGREGIGICVVCRRVVCVECSTKIAGVNHCRACLAARAGTAGERRPSRAGGVIQALAALALVLLSLLATTGLLAAWGDARTRGAGRVLDNRERLESIARALEAFRRDVGRLPGEREGLRALVARRAVQGDARAWRGPYVDLTWAHGEGLADAFGQPVRYRAPPDGGGPAAIGSAGADRRFESDLEGAAPVTPGEMDAAASGDDLILVVE